jgi:hypothetical protein
MAEYGPVNDLTSSSWPTTDLFSFGLRPDAAQYRPRHQIGIRFSSGARIKRSVSRSDARVGNLERPDRQTQAEVGFELTLGEYATRSYQKILVMPRDDGARDRSNRRHIRAVLRHATLDHKRVNEIVASILDNRLRIPILLRRRIYLPRRPQHRPASYIRAPHSSAYVGLD